MKKAVLTISVLLGWAISTIAQPCLPDGITFTTQSQIDSFPINYPGCTEIEGHLKIAGSDITNIDSLNVLTSIGGYLQLGDYMIPNTHLSNLNGFENLVSIGGDLIIGFYYGENSQLSSLVGLTNLTEINGLLGIGYNPVLENLWGLDNIGASSISDINIIYNQSLTTCDVQSICDYIGSPNGNLQIHDNAPGCNTIEEAEDACESAVISEMHQLVRLLNYPNPFTTSTSIEYELREISNIQFTVYNVMGKVVYETENRMMPRGTYTVTWSPDHLPDGMYYAVLRSDDGVSVVKMVKQ